MYPQGSAAHLAQADYERRRRNMEEEAKARLARAQTYADEAGPSSDVQAAWDRVDERNAQEQQTKDDRRQEWQQMIRPFAAKISPYTRVGYTCRDYAQLPNSKQLRSAEHLRYHELGRQYQFLAPDIGCDRQVTFEPAYARRKAPQNFVNLGNVQWFVWVCPDCTWPEHSNPPEKRKADFGRLRVQEKYSPEFCKRVEDLQAKDDAEDQVEFAGEKTREQRDAEGFKNAIVLSSDDDDCKAQDPSHATTTTNAFESPNVSPGPIRKKLNTGSHDKAEDLLERFLADVIVDPPLKKEFPPVENGDDLD